MRILPVLIAVSIIAFVAYYFTSTPSPESQPASEPVVGDTTSDEAVEEGQDAVIEPAQEQVVPGESVNEERESEAASPASTQPNTSPVVSGKTSIVFPYSELLYSTTYMVGWQATAGTKATLTLEKGGTTYGTVDGCTDMPVKFNQMQYCTWEQAPVDDDAGTRGFTFKLTVTDAEGNTLQSATSRTFTLVPRSTFLTEPYRDNQFGWSVRHPKGWFVKGGSTRTVVADSILGLSAPLSSNEAFVIEYCSSARESCKERVTSFKAKSYVREATLGGKRSLRRVYAEGGGYVAEDMLERQGLVYFVQRAAADVSGTVISPYVREGLLQFNYETSRTEVDVYELDEMFRAGSLLIEYADNIPEYVRIYTGGLSCSAEISSATFEEAGSQKFAFTVDGCRIEGNGQSDNTFELEENGCEAFHTDECEFEGTYEPVD